MQETLRCVILVAAGIVAGCMPSETRDTVQLGNAGVRETEAPEAVKHEGPAASHIGSEGHWYCPRPKSEWQVNFVADIDREATCDYTMVVIVIGSFNNQPHRVGGNGVVLRCLGNWGRGGAPVLTCAHIVKRETREALEIRVGVFDHSLELNMHNTPEYQELAAGIVAIDAESDLALLELHSPMRLHGVTALEPRGTVNGRMVAISIFPHREPLQHEGYDLYFTDGNSGSPIFLGSKKLFALAQGRLEAGLGEDIGLGYWIDSDVIREFLRVNGLNVLDVGPGSGSQGEK